MSRWLVAVGGASFAPQVATQIAACSASWSVPSLAHVPSLWLEAYTMDDNMGLFLLYLPPYFPYAPPLWGLLRSLGAVLATF